MIAQIRFHELVGFAVVFEEGAEGFPAQAGEEGYIFFLNVGGELPAALLSDIAHRFPDQQFSCPGMTVFLFYGQPAPDPVSVIFIGEDPDRPDNLIF